MARSRLLLLGLALIMAAALPAPAGAATFDAAPDFSTASNPNGPWSYGATTTLGALTLYTVGDHPSGLDRWHIAPGIPESLGAPAVVHNATASPFTGAITIPPGALDFHPGPNGEFSVIRWTAPAPGTYGIAATFTGADSTTTDVHVLRGSTPLFSGAINGVGDVASFATTATLGAGETIDFAVGAGGNGFFSDSTFITATISDATVFVGPTPYLSQADSPFAAAIASGDVFLETFEDGALNTPGVTASAGSVIPPGFGGLIDSVDGDDGSINGSGLGGHSLFSGSGATGIRFTFNAAALGGLPTQAGVVWTDGAGTTTFEAFDAAGASLGRIGPVAIADGSFGGTTAEDRFFGVVHLGGISAIKLSNTSGGIEVDHLQYGHAGLADLAVASAAAPDPVFEGSPLTYTVTVVNHGPSTASVVSLTHALSAAAVIGPITATQGACSGTGPVVCNLGSLASGASATVTIAVTPSGSAAITGTATVSGGVGDPNAANNEAVTVTTIQPLAPPAAPTGLTATVSPGSRVALAWTDTSDNESAFQIERRSTGRFARVATVPAGAVSFEDRAVAAGRVYTYRVRAINAAGASAFSNDATLALLVPRLAVRARVLRFPPTPAGSARTLTLVIRNDGTAPVSGHVVLPPSAFALAGDGSFALPPRSSVAVLVEFRPTARGPAETTLTVVPDAPGGPAIAVRAVGLAR